MEEVSTSEFDLPHLLENRPGTRSPPDSDEKDSEFDALYLLSRCYEDVEGWISVEMVYKKMAALYEEAIEKGLDSTSFRKFRYRLAVLNERVYGDPGAGIMRSLIAENPGYDPYYRAIRWMLQANREAVAAADANENLLVKSMFNSEQDDSEFLDLLSKVRAEHKYRKLVVAYEVLDVTVAAIFADKVVEMVPIKEV